VFRRTRRAEEAGLQLGRRLQVVLADDGGCGERVAKIAAISSWSAMIFAQFKHDLGVGIEGFHLSASHLHVGGCAPLAAHDLELARQLTTRLRRRWPLRVSLDWTRKKITQAVR